MSNKDSAPIIGYRYDVNLLSGTDKLTPFLQEYLQVMGWKDLNWLEDVHMGYEEGRPAVFDRNINGWVTVPAEIELPDNQQDRDMIARELLVKFQMSENFTILFLLWHLCKNHFSLFLRSCISDYLCLSRLRHSCEGRNKVSFTIFFRYCRFRWNKRRVAFRINISLVLKKSDYWFF